MKAQLQTATKVFAITIAALFTMGLSSYHSSHTWPLEDEPTTPWPGTEGNPVVSPTCWVRTFSACHVAGPRTVTVLCPECGNAETVTATDNEGTKLWAVQVPQDGWFKSEDDYDGLCLWSRTWNSACTGSGHQTTDSNTVLIKNLDMYCRYNGSSAP